MITRTQLYKYVRTINNVYGLNFKVINKSGLIRLYFNDNFYYSGSKSNCYNIIDSFVKGYLLGLGDGIE